MSNLHHIHISVTFFSSGLPYVMYYESNNGDVRNDHLWHETDITPYFLQMWELVKRGGKRKVEVNPYAPKCYTVETEWWEFS